MKVVLSKKNGKPYKHAFILFEIDGERELWGVADGAVRRVVPKKGWVHDVFDLRWSDQRAYYHEKQIYDWIRKQEGKKESFFRVGFRDKDPEVVKEKRKQSGKWKGAELVYAALRKGGVRVFGGEWQWPHTVTAQMLFNCPNLGHIGELNAS